VKNKIKFFVINLIEKIQVYRIRKIYCNRIRNIQNSLGIKTLQLNKQEKGKILSMWSRLAGSLNFGWHNWYKINSLVFDEKNVPEDLFYSIIEPRLSPRRYAEAYEDKGILNLLFPTIPQPKCFIKNINGSFYADTMSFLTKKESIEKLTNEVTKFVIKPTINTSQGKDVDIIDFDNIVSNDKLEYIDNLFSKYNENFIIQEVISQSAETACYNPNSLNTMRIISLFLNNKVSVLSGVLRMGMSGSVIDNFTAGGIAVGIKPNGFLSSCGIDIEWKQYKKSSTGIIFEGKQCPSYLNIVSLIDGYHKMMPHCHLISWDFAIDKNGTPILIEVNLTFQELNFHQFHNGSLFKDRTDEVIKFIELNKVNWFNIN
jgi:Sugar-transfer associated ATP-grasp